MGSSKEVGEDLGCVRPPAEPFDRALPKAVKHRAGESEI